MFRGPTCLPLVSAFGYADRGVHGADRDPCLTLSPAQRVRIQVPGCAGRLPEGVVFVLDFERGRYTPEIEETEEHSRAAEPQGPSVTVFGDPHDVILDPEGEATVTFPSAGPWIVAIGCYDLVRDRVFYAEDLGLAEAVNWPGSGLRSSLSWDSSRGHGAPSPWVAAQTVASLGLRGPTRRGPRVGRPAAEPRCAHGDHVPSAERISALPRSRMWLIGKDMQSTT